MQFFLVRGDLDLPGCSPIWSNSRAESPSLFKNLNTMNCFLMSRQIYVSGTAWKGTKAVRIAVSHWKVDVSKGFEVITSVLNGVVN
ncbi:hypothetical protein FOVG_14355 [Fusarium oxysporum f. sp. pisi HDV247]|uniref:Uncharacterized protein n=1 Tax=Fusarium oxysporum f. sp. pisi HDV247 TaxID=1080344 RepID=W9NUK1_FUSOX|nr:hypothetical protein FOVG_14355 [Fusarium oxysporum f. sp. pisi HDV247]